MRVGRESLGEGHCARGHLRVEGVTCEGALYWGAFAGG